MKFWLGKKELYSLSFISLWSLSTCSDRACHTNFPRICSVFSPICCFKFGQMESSWLPFFIHLRKAQKAKTGFKCPNTTQDVRLWPEHSENSRSREFFLELGSFFLARPWEISLHILFPSRNTRLWKKISHSRLEPWDTEIKNLALVSNPEMLRKKSRSRLEPWDVEKKILFSSQTLRFKEENSRSRLQPWD